MDFPRGLLIVAMVAGAVLGGTGGLFGAIAGAAVAAALVYLSHLNRTVAELRRRVERVERLQGIDEAETPPRPAPSRAPAAVRQPPAPARELQSARETEQTTAEAPSTPDPPADAEWQQPPPPAEPDPATRLIRAGVDYLTTGNLVVKVAVLVLFVGVGFLLKYAAERDIFPIEFRLAGVFAAGVVGLAVGWRLRIRNPGYALVLQGGAFGVMYLTVFAAAKLYSVIPLGLAFAVMVVLIVCSAMLAILQNSRALAVFSLAGGFLAPILVSSGSGNHVLLFSYFALLNFGVFGIAWYRSWRILNWLGFMFTFLITSMWVANDYEPAWFLTTEPFLAIFFLQYLIISILYAHKQPPDVRGWVDGSLVFGLPLFIVGLQSAVVHHFEFGMAYSALGLSIVYLAAAKLLWNNLEEGMPALTEAFAALSLIFGTMAIPFALDGRWTAASWSIEGAALVWLGLRQRRLLARGFGSMLYVFGGLAYWMMNSPRAGDLPVFNSAFIGCFLISVAGLLASYLYSASRQTIRSWEQPASAILLVVALIWWFGNGLDEIDRFVSGHHVLDLSLVFLSVSFAALALASTRLDWFEATAPPILHLPAGFFLLAYGLFTFTDYNPLTGLSIAAWLIMILTSLWILWELQRSWPVSLMAVFHAGGWYLVTLILSAGLGRWVDQNATLAGSWATATRGVIPAIAGAVLLAARHRRHWPLSEFRESYCGAGIFPVAIGLLLWMFGVCLMLVQSDPLPYMPVLNPRDVAVLVIIAFIGSWLILWRPSSRWRMAKSPFMIAFLSLAAFIWLNAMVANSVHYYAGVPFTWPDLASSAIFQTLISILWTVCAFAVMALGVRLVIRNIWFCGATLLALVVVKLFMVDLAGIGTIARIISFLSVGGLMLLIGYLYPLPPAHRDKDTAS